MEPNQSPQGQVIDAEFEVLPDEYHEDYDHVSATMLKDFDESPKAFCGYYVTKTKPRPAPTATMDIGSVVHAVFLEQRRLEDIATEYPPCCLDRTGSLNPTKASQFRQWIRGDIEIEVWPDEFLTPSGSRSTSKAATTWAESRTGVSLSQNDFDEFVNAAGYVPYVMKKEDVDRCRAIVASLRASPAAQWIDCPTMIREQPIRWVEGGQKYRCKPDFRIEGVDNTVLQCHELIFDLKVTAHWNEFERYSKAQKAAISHAHYLSGVYHLARQQDPNAPINCFDIDAYVKMLYVTVNPEWPHEVAIHGVAPNDILTAFTTRAKIIADLNKARTTGNWEHPKSQTSVNFFSFY